MKSASPIVLLVLFVGLFLLLPSRTMAQGANVNTTFVITPDSSNDPTKIWVTFAGTFQNNGYNQYAGTNVLTTSTWQQFQLSDLLSPALSITGTNGVESSSAISYFTGDQYNFSLNDFSGRVYINYGDTGLTAAPDPSNPGTSPYVVFEPTVAGLTILGTGPTASNMDLSYVDGVSAQAGTNIRNATTGAALAATSNNPITSTPNILSNVAALVPAAAAVYNTNGDLVRVMSSAAAPSAYHGWANLITTLETTTATSGLNVNSYTSPMTTSGGPNSLNNALFGYSGAGTIVNQPPNFNVAQSYTTTAVFTTNMTGSLTPTQLTALTNAGIAPGTAGAVISGSGSVAGSFQIFIPEANLTAGTGIYGNNPGYIVLVGNTAYNYSAAGIQNDLSGRVVGDLVAGIVFGWSNSTIDIPTWAASTGTNLYGATFGSAPGSTFSSTTLGKLSTGEYFYLLSLAAAQGKLPDWIGGNADSNPDDYDAYLAAISANSDAYASGFTDRLQGPGAPGTFWYTNNPPADPNSPGNNFENVGFVQFTLGNLNPVPEPGTYILLGLGVVVLGIIGMRRQRTRV